MHAVKTALALSCWLVLTGCLSAQELSPPASSDLTVGEIDLTSIKWGWRPTAFDVTNHSDDVKFVTVQVEVQCSGSYLLPDRRTKSHYIIEPRVTKAVRPTVYVPGNFGEVTITVSLWDVADTLDLLLPYQKFFQQPFTVHFHVPPALAAYVDEKSTMPPMVEKHPDFDNEFARLLPLLLSEGRSPEEIAEIARAEIDYVQEMIRRMTLKGYLRDENGSPVVAFPVITVAEAEEGRELAMTVADSLAVLIEINMGQYRRVLDSLIAAETINADSNAFLDAGGILHRPYPVVSALLLWFELGRKFITRSAQLQIYHGTDPCNAHIPNYMYLVRGGDVFNGTQFYAFFPAGQAYQIYFGDEIPTLHCGENFILKARLGHRVFWRHRPKYNPESFMFDTTLARPMLQVLSVGTDSLLVDNYFRMRDIAVKYGHEKLSLGERYWFWNLVATRTLKALVDKGVLTRRGNGQFKLEGVKGTG